MKTRTILLLIVGVCATGALAVLIGIVLAAGPTVEVVRVAREPIQEYVEEPGVTRLPTTTLVTMPYAGRLETLTLTEGDSVESGAAVAQLVQQDLDLAVAEAQAVVDRLDAAIAENSHVLMENLAMIQANEFVQSMANTVLVAKTQVESGKAKLDFFQNQLQRIRPLHESNTVGDEELELAELDVITAAIDSTQDELVVSITKAVEAATRVVPEMVKQLISDKTLTDAVLRKQPAEAAARLEKVELQRQRGTIFSPIDGVVLRRFVTNERFLPAGEPLLELGRLENLEIEADVLSLDVVNADEGDRVEIYGPTIGAGRRHGRSHAAGVIHKIYPAGFTKISSLGVEQQRVKVIIRIDPADLAWLRAERNLGVGYRVRTRLFTAEKPDALVVPRSALFRRSDGDWLVYVVREGRAASVTVTVGLSNDRQAEILTGVAEGDQVVRSPEAGLADGQRVKPRQQ